MIASNSSRDGGQGSSASRAGSFTFGERAGFGSTSQKSNTCRIEPR